MKKELEKAEAQAGWTVTSHDLDTAPLPEGVLFAGMRIRTFDCGSGRSEIVICSINYWVEIKEWPLLSAG